MQCKQCYERNGIFLDILDLMEETFFWCNISQAVTLGLLLFCLEFRPCTALQTFFWVSLHFLLVSSIFWEGVNFPLGFYRYYAQKRRRLAFLLNISYWKPTSSYVVFAGKGYDLLAINTQRGRDHGLGGYNAYRSFFGLERISSMDQRPIEIAPDAWEAFQLVYRDPDDIDLFVGGLSETPMQGRYNQLLSSTLESAAAQKVSIIDFQRNSIYTIDR